MAANRKDVMDFDEEEQNKGSIVIAGFEISKKTLIVIGIGILILIGIIAGNSVIQKRKDAERMAEYQAKVDEYNKTHQTVQDTRTLDERMQDSLVQRFGNPPEGFKWGMDGSLIPLSDASSCEDVIFAFMRALSTLDFSTAQRYSKDSRVISNYESYYDIASQGITNYYDNFLRKQYKKSLTSLEVLNIGDTAIDASGTEYVTLDIACLDLEDKDFWLDDKDMIYTKMFSYQGNEDDQVKAKQFLYDYIYSKYEDGTIGKKKHTIELVCSKEVNKGWLVSNDKELESYLSYDKGLDVAQYILDQFQSYYLERSLSTSTDDGQEWSDISQYQEEKYDGSEKGSQGDAGNNKVDSHWEVSVIDPDSHVWTFVPYGENNFLEDNMAVDLLDVPYDIVEMLYDEAYKNSYIKKNDKGQYIDIETGLRLSYPNKEDTGASENSIVLDEGSSETEEQE